MKIFLQLFLIILLFTGCKKNELGGKAEITGSVVHHTKAIPGATVYIRFNAREFPGSDTSRYDASVVADAEGRFAIKAYKGDYFLYATGIDYQPQPLYVAGGVPVSLRNKEKLEVKIAVSEEH